MASKEMVSDSFWAGLFVCKKSKSQTKQLFQQSCGCCRPKYSFLTAGKHGVQGQRAPNSPLLPPELAVALIRGGAGIQIPFGRGLVTWERSHLQPCPDPTSFPSPQLCSPTMKAPRTRR